MERCEVPQDCYMCRAADMAHGSRAGSSWANVLHPHMGPSERTALAPLLLQGTRPRASPATAVASPGLSPTAGTGPQDTLAQHQLPLSC